jgi:hypothetical protein
LCAKGRFGFCHDLGIATGLLEPAGWALGGTINTLSYIVWALWLIAIGVTLLVRCVKPDEPYVVDDSAYAAEFGGDATPLREAIHQTVAWARGRGERQGD